MDDELKKALPLLFREGPWVSLAELEGISEANISLRMRPLIVKGYVKGPYIPAIPALGLGIAFRDQSQSGDEVLFSVRSGTSRFSLILVSPERAMVEEFVYRARVNGRKVSKSEVHIDLTPSDPPQLEKADHDVIRTVAALGKARYYTPEGIKIPSWKVRFSDLKKNRLVEKRYVLADADWAFFMAWHDSDELPEPDPFCLTLIFKDGRALSFFMRKQERFPSMPVSVSMPFEYRLSFNRWRALTGMD